MAHYSDEKNDDTFCLGPGLRYSLAQSDNDVHCKPSNVVGQVNGYRCGVFCVYHCWDRYGLVNLTCGRSSEPGKIVIPTVHMGRMSSETSY